MPVPHPPEFRQRAIALAKDLQVSGSYLRCWLARAERDEDRREGLTSDERKDVAALRRGKRRLEVENEILRRAAATVGQSAAPCCSETP